MRLGFRIILAKYLQIENLDIHVLTNRREYLQKFCKYILAKSPQFFKGSTAEDS